MQPNRTGLRAVFQLIAFYYFKDIKFLHARAGNERKGKQIRKENIGEAQFKDTSNAYEVLQNTY